MKKQLLTGLVILLPVALTLMVIVFLFDLFTAPFVDLVGPLVEMIPYQLPHGFVLFLSRILSLVLLCIFILILGVITQLFMVKILINWGNQIDRKSTRLNSSHLGRSRMPSSA